MKIKVQFKNPKTNKIKTVKVGESALLFFSPFLLGIPCFLRGLYGWGVATILALIAFNFLLLVRQTLGDDAWALINFIMFFLLLPMFWVAFNGNKMTAKKYLKQGWEFVNPDSAEVALAKKAWKIE